MLRSLVGSEMCIRDRYRSIVWLQGIQDANTERSRAHHLTRRLDTQEFRIGRLKHERVTVPRGDQVLNSSEIIKMNEILNYLNLLYEALSAMCTIEEYN